MEALLSFTILTFTNFPLSLFQLVFLLRVNIVFSFLLPPSGFWMNLVLHLHSRQLLLGNFAPNRIKRNYLLRALVASAGDPGQVSDAPLLLHPLQVAV